MASRSPLGRLSGVMVGAVLLGAMVGACWPGIAPQNPATAGAASPSGGSPDLASPTVPGSPAGTVGPSPSVAGRDAPPDALLAAEGGDPVPGQLGTFIWLDSGSDSPWLPGAPLAVGAAEPLTLTLVPEGNIGTWRARYAPADASGPDGAAVLGAGIGTPAFDAPGAGAWTVEVYIEFANGVGTASYFWRLEVE